MNIRRAIADDATDISLMEEEYFSDPWSRKDIFGYVCSSDSMSFVATSDSGEVIAYILGRIIAPEGEIYRIAVKESHRRRGVGYRLLSYTLKTERGRGLESTFLEVRAGNVAAIALYRAYGFTDIGVRKNYYKNPTEDAIVMMLGK